VVCGKLFADPYEVGGGGEENMLEYGSLDEVAALIDRVCS
jgi:hypothetical protein